MGTLRVGVYLIIYGRYVYFGQVKEVWLFIVFVKKRL